jgi:arylformamidase
VNAEAIIELSHRMIPGRENFRLEVRNFDVTELLPEVVHRPEIWYILTDITMSSHMGTHVEFPYHHWEPGVDAAEFPLANLIGDAVVLDFSHKAHGEAIALAELQAHAHRLREGDIVFIRTDMDRLFRTERWADQPYLTEEAMGWLIETFHPRVIGTDASGFEVPGTDFQPNHLRMFQSGIAMVESATNLAAIGEERALCFILPLPIERADACPVRIVAFRQGAFDHDP